ncbi:HNH endonuclease [Curtobacterium flaccumfaciens pv. flaccumfaciens]|uniref:HNH endonuclease n=1 Tax=Curtobacterium flaccumfaciens TaxID=2035 RepID=UPI00217D179E|nr:HNH endonuclease [Curtobacterium flaccumfaciens]MCS6547181.1 HNH endonuclease [Curtobacterium flaccumfaciens pv. flaccumfaciens]
MKRIERGEQPAVLIQNGRTWTEAYVSAEAGKPRRSAERWRDDNIRNRLTEDALGLCMYCESRVEDVGDLNVEHIKPKSEFPELAHVWGNLGYSCLKCNRNKSDYYDATLPVIDPYVEDPDNFLDVLGDLIVAKPNNERGRVSVWKLDLQRIALRNSRAERVEKVLLAVAEYERANGVFRDLLREAILKDARRGEYSASVFSYLQIVGFLAREDLVA